MQPRHGAGTLVILVVLCACGLDSHPGSGRDGAVVDAAGDDAMVRDDGGRDAGGRDASAPDASDVDGGPQACAVNSDCVVVPQSCCGDCGAAVPGDAVAIARTRLSEHQAQACGGTMGCPACFRETDPNLIAGCNQGRCELVDVRQSDPLSICMEAQECRVRMAGCCACQELNLQRVIALRVGTESLYQALTCDPGDGCPECEPDLFPAVALCIDNRCTATMLDTTQ